MKREFKLDSHKADLSGAYINIIGSAPENKPYVTINLPGTLGSLFVEDKDLEKLANNIIKALNKKKSKKKKIKYCNYCGRRADANYH